MKKLILTLSIPLLFSCGGVSSLQKHQIKSARNNTHNETFWVMGVIRYNMPAYFYAKDGCYRAIVSKEHGESSFINIMVKDGYVLSAQNSDANSVLAFDPPLELRNGKAMYDNGSVLIAIQRKNIRNY